MAWLDGTHPSLDHRRFVAGELLGLVHVLVVASGEHLQLNATASAMWALIAGGATVGEIASGLVAEYCLDEPQADRAVEDFLAELEQRGLLMAAR